MTLGVKPWAQVLCVPALVLFSLTLVNAQAPSTQEQQPSDNTKLNQRDRSKAEVTADQQKEKRSDRELTRDIRRAILKDKSLSTDAHNVKVIAQNGMVTLKGPVRSEDEKQAIEATAAEVAGQDKVGQDKVGQDKVKSELHVTAEHGKKPSPYHYR